MKTESSLLQQQMMGNVFHVDFLEFFFRVLMKIALQVGDRKKKLKCTVFIKRIFFNVDFN